MPINFSLQCPKLELQPIFSTTTILMIRRLGSCFVNLPMSSMAPWPSSPTSRSYSYKPSHHVSLPPDAQSNHQARKAFHAQQPTHHPHLAARRHLRTAAPTTSTTWRAPNCYSRSRFNRHLCNQDTIKYAPALSSTFILRRAAAVDEKLCRSPPLLSHET